MRSPPLPELTLPQSRKHPAHACGHSSFQPGCNSGGPASYRGEASRLLLFLGGSWQWNGGRAGRFREPIFPLIYVGVLYTFSLPPEEGGG